MDISSVGYLRSSVRVSRTSGIWLACVALLLSDDGQFDATEEAALHAIKLFSEKGNQFDPYRFHHVLGEIY